MCEAANSQLLSFQSPEEAQNLVSFIQRTNPRRTRFEFWTGGNDIDKESKSNFMWISLIEGDSKNHKKVFASELFDLCWWKLHFTTFSFINSR